MTDHCILPPDVETEFSCIPLNTLFSFLGLNFLICKMKWLDFIRYLKFFSAVGVGRKFTWIAGKKLLVWFKSHLFLLVSSSESLQHVFLSLYAFHSSCLFTVQKISPVWMIYPSRFMLSESFVYIESRHTHVLLMHSN